MGLIEINKSSSTFEIVPLVYPEKKCNFGAMVKGVDLNNISDDDLLKLKKAIWTYKLLLVKGQESLSPKKNWEILKRFDPDAPQFTQDEFAKQFHPSGEGIVKKIHLTGLPGVEDVHLVGKGYQGEDHFGLKNMTLGEAFGGDFFVDRLSEELFESGHTRFQSWHIDGPLYKGETPLFSSFRTIKLPEGPNIDVHWDDGSGLTMNVKPGRTAFFSTSQLYNLLSDEEKNMADHSWVEYMYYPYEWIRGTRGQPNGLGAASEGRETPMEEMEQMTGRDEAWIKKYPMVWLNPLTKEKAFQVQPNTVRKIFIRHGPNDVPRVIDDIAEVRAFIANIQTRILRPEYILVEPEEEGDMLLWDNWGLMHTRIDYPVKYGIRTAHQAWISRALGSGPVGPVGIPAAV